MDKAEIARDAIERAVAEFVSESIDKMHDSVSVVLTVRQLDDGLRLEIETTEDEGPEVVTVTFGD